MPFQSKAQKKYLFALHPDIAHKFMLHDKQKPSKKEARQQAIERRMNRGKK